jgi:glutamate--cysteine ligase
VSLTVEQARDQVRQRCFTPSSSRRIGLEGEWHVYDVGDPAQVVALHDVEAVVSSLGPLPFGSRVTFEPGGQLELSSPPASGVDAACDALAGDRAVVADALARENLALVAVGVDPVRAPVRQLHRPRYDAMEAFFDRFGTAGRRMMCRTAALQINVDLGPEEQAEQRWRRAHLVGPTLSSAFAMSPMAEGAPTGWASTRLATWLAIDPSRTAAVTGGREAFVRYALDANVMLVRQGEQFVPVRDRVSFAEWIGGAPGLGAPTPEDLDYHLTTLFPPVRPRGWMELRYLDALPSPWWRVAAAVVCAVLDDDAAGAAAEEACTPVATRWCAAARYGLSDPELRDAAIATVGAAREAFGRLGVSTAVDAACDLFLGCYLRRGRGPGDDVLRAWRRDESVVAGLIRREERWT